jgi:hypothetical protein
LVKAGQVGLGLSLAPQLEAPAGCGSSGANTVRMLFQINPSEIFA